MTNWIYYVPPLSWIAILLYHLRHRQKENFEDDFDSIDHLLMVIIGNHVTILLMAITCLILLIIETPAGI